MEASPHEAIATSATLAYKNAYVSFIYSFSWDVTKRRFADLAKELELRGWKKDKLHQRHMDFNGKNRTYGAYRPSLLTGCQDAVYHTHEIPSGLEVITPLEDDWHDDGTYRTRRCPVAIKYYIRFLENGAGVCNLSVGLSEGTATFENIHSVLHLGDNLSFDLREEKAKPPHVCSYLRMPKDPTDPDLCWVTKLRNQNKVVIASQGKAGKTMEFFRNKEVNGENLPDSVFSMQELVNRLFLVNVERMPKNWLDPETPSDSLWLDWELLKWERDNEEKQYRIDYAWQNPFVFTICEGPGLEDGKSFSAQAIVTSRGCEIASTLTKMNLNNDRIGKDFHFMGDDYISYALPFNSERKALRNLSHDDRLFFTFSRRGALAITAKMDEIPGYFVLPSFVNLLEILRARWHLGNVVNLELDAAIERLVSLPDPPTSDSLAAVYRARTMLAMFLRDPVPYLFDGGAVTEIAQLADTELWLSRLRICADEKLTALDKLIQHAQLAKAYESLDVARTPETKPTFRESVRSLLKPREEK
jgi:hypothetical protein